MWGGVETSESKDVVLYALANGISVFDTAPSYAEAEKVLGAALREWRGNRPFVSTKVGRLKASTAHDVKLDYSNEGMTRSFENSLSTMGLDFVDLLFLHEPQLVPTAEIPRILEHLQSLVDQGLVGKLGIGGNLTDAFRPYMGPGKFEVISGFLRMNACNLDVFTNDISFIKSNKLAYYNASILHFGLLGTRLETYKQNIAQESDWLLKRDIDIAEDLLALAGNWGMSLASLAQRYAFGMADADRIVVGGKNMSQVTRTLSDWEEGPLSKPKFEEVTKLIMNHY